MWQKEENKMRRCKCGLSFWVLLALALYTTIIHLPKWSQIISKHTSKVSGLWGKTLDASNHVLDNIKTSRKLVPRYNQITCGTKTKPHRSIFYVKVHKTASTTLRSMLLIYGREYNLTICMDSMNLWGLNWPYIVDEERLTKLKEERCQIVAEELVYSPAIVDRLMADNVFILASVRHPVKHFISLFKYSNIQGVVERLIDKKLDPWEAMRVFLRNPDLIQNMYATYKEEEVRDIHQVSMVRPNLQLFDLGLSNPRTTAEEIVERLSQVHFIVVAEHFDESMVILRDKLCCSVEDVVYRKQNVRQAVTSDSIPNDIQTLIMDFNSRDVILYKHALRQLDKEIKQQPHFDNLLEIYRHELRKYEAKCTDKTFPEDLKSRLCPPITNGQVGVFVEDVRKGEREKLLAKLKSKYVNNKIKVNRTSV